MAIPLGKIAPALACGNTVVWKPAPAATRISEFLWQLIQASGIPSGAVRLVTGDHTTAQRLAMNSNVAAVTFTGSRAGGHAMQEICATRMVPLQAELSGNNAAVVCEDADLASAAREIARGALAFAGQRCTANRRAIVPRRLCERFLSELQDAGERLTWGDPLNPDVEIGPVISLTKRDEIASVVVSITAADGRRTRLLHERLAKEPWVQAGAYLQPAIICCEDPGDALVQEEFMAPLLIVQPADDFDHAIALCNGVRHGLSAALFSNDPGCRRRFLEEAQAGVLKFNASTAGVDVTLPFGGWKASGLGPPEHGEGDRLFYTRLQTIYGAQESNEI